MQARVKDILVFWDGSARIFIDVDTKGKILKVYPPDGWAVTKYENDCVFLRAFPLGVLESRFIYPHLNLSIGDIVADVYEPRDMERPVTGNVFTP